jgi:hypothetical protein
MSLAHPISGSLDGLQQCPNVRDLIAHDNLLTGLERLQACRNLWNLDLTGNKVR